MPEELLELALEQLDEGQEVHETTPSSKAPTSSSDGEVTDEGAPQLHALQQQQQSGGA
jgi:hypothetical protein